MHAIRAVDGLVYAIPSNGHGSGYDALHAHLCHISGIPPAALIAMHPTGRQMEHESAKAMLDDDYEDEDEDATVYLFDKQLLELDLASQEGTAFLRALDLDIDAVLHDTHQNGGSRLLLLCLAFHT